MNLKFFDKTITLFHYDGKKYSKSVFSQVFMIEKESIQISSDGEAKTSNILIRIPILDKKPIINKGDYIVVGKIKKEFNLKEFLLKYKTYKIISLRNNSTGGLPHIKIEGKC